MRLSGCRFYNSGEELNFSIFSDEICRAKHIESFVMNVLREIQVDVYEIAPAIGSRWVLVSQTNSDETIYKWFLRKGDEFLETEERDVPNRLRSEVLRRFPRLAAWMPTAA